ncbi:MAG: energy-coupling factor ABC transporter ATP-binding protein [Candidatus Heimdallarchaeota archaeon]
MIEINNIRFQYSNTEKPILNDFSLQISKGEFIGIIGPTGCGKSTICYLFNGLIPHLIKGTFQGSASINGLDTLTSSVGELSKLVGYMLQEPSFQIATPHVKSEIAFGMENMGLPRDEMEERLHFVLDTLNIQHLQERATSDMSEGEKQRVILASILAMKPEILVLDECSSMLDIASKNKLATTLKDLNKKHNKTIVMVDHDLDYLLSLVDRIILINEGQIIADNSTDKILTDIKLLTSNGLIPPEIVKLFNEIKKDGIPVDTLPASYKIAEKKIRSWLK